MFNGPCGSRSDPATKQEIAKTGRSACAENRYVDAKLFEGVSMTYRLSNGNLLVSVVETSPTGDVEALVQIESRTREYKEFELGAVPMSYEDEVVFRLLHGLPLCEAVVGNN